MKKLKRFFGVLLFIVLLSCGNDRKTNAPTVGNEPSSPLLNDAPPTVKDSYDKSGNAIDSMDKDARTTKMFADLNFTQEQMDKYRAISRQERENWMRTNANSKMPDSARLRQEDKNMKSFLSQAQYEQYQKWVKDNPVKGQRVN